MFLFIHRVLTNLTYITNQLFLIVKLLRFFFYTFTASEDLITLRNLAAMSNATFFKFNMLGYIGIRKYISIFKKQI